MSDTNKALQRFRGIVALVSASADGPPSSDTYFLVRAGLDQAELLVQEIPADAGSPLLLEMLGGVSFLHMAGVIASAGHPPQDVAPIAARTCVDRSGAYLH